MRTRFIAFALVCVPTVLAFAAAPPVVLFDPADFLQPVENPYFPLRPGTIYIYKSITPDGTEIDQMTITSERKTIQGVSTVVVRDRVFLNGEVSEDTLDWYAADRIGNVWYFGEDSKAFEHGVLVSTAGSWEGGKNDAHPGIIMEAHPRVGDLYRQEFQAGEAEDMAKVVSVNTTAPLPTGWAMTFPLGIFNFLNAGNRFENVVKTREWSPLETGNVEFKYFAPGIGQVYGVENDHGTIIITRLVAVYGP